jgi:DMSO/TMAO reductase YedYZ molybdopterin-dependent catalytic subunit
LGLLGLGAAGVVGGHWVQDGLSRLLAPVEQRDPTGLLSLFPLGATFRYYSVTGAVARRDATTYRLDVDGLVARPATYSLGDLRAMPQVGFDSDFHCVTGWYVLGVPWAGVPLSQLISRASPAANAKAVRFHSFDGTYTESLPLAAAMRPDVIVALQMYGKPVTHDHGGPARIYASSMYGYKSTKWLSRIELTDTEVPGYWETRGYDIDGTIRN